MNIEIPNAFFLVSGKGAGQSWSFDMLNEKDSFDLALTDAGVAVYNHAYVSSIVPPRCGQISAKDGIDILVKNKGAFVKSVMPIESTCEEGFIAAAVAVAFPEEEGQIGYAAECHGIFHSSSDAIKMLEETESAAKVWLARKNVTPKNEVASVLSCVKSEGGLWMTVLAAAVFIQPCFYGAERLSTP